MDLRQLRGAVELARQGTFSRAAESLGVAQPAISQSIAALERELGILLFRRSSRRVTLTEAGTAFVNRAAAILGDVAALGATMSQHSGALRGRVNVASILFFGQSALPQLVAAFAREHPDVTVVVNDDGTPNILARLDAGQIDVGFASVSNAELPPDIAVEVLHRDEVVVMLPPRHPLNKAAVVTFADLRDEAFVGHGEGSGLGDIEHQLAAEAGFSPRVKVESRSTFLVRPLVARGLGVAIGMKEHALSPGARVGVLALSPQRWVTTALLTRRDIDVNPAARAFADLARALFVRERAPSNGGEARR